jgi:hypothetical protein
MRSLNESSKIAMSSGEIVSRVHIRATNNNCVEKVAESPTGMRHHQHQHPSRSHYQTVMTIHQQRIKFLPYTLSFCILLVVGNIAFIARQQSALHVLPLSQQQQYGGDLLINSDSHYNDPSSWMNQAAFKATSLNQHTRNLRAHTQAQDHNEPLILRQDVQDITSDLRNQIVALNGAIARLKYDVVASMKQDILQELIKLQLDTLDEHEDEEQEAGQAVALPLEKRNEKERATDSDNSDVSLPEQADNSTPPAEDYFNSIRDDNETNTLADSRMADDFMWHREIDNGEEDDDDDDDDSSSSYGPPVIVINNPIYHHGDPPSCDMKSEGPTPVVLMTLGRSGSASTWQVLGNLTGEETHSVETTGSDGMESKKFFRNVTNTTTNGNWALKILCQKQKRHPDAGIVGFKWKPFASTFFTQGATDALEMMSYSHHPMIKVVRSRRNVLDVLISGYKHQVAATAEDKPKAHCKKGDEECIQKHIQTGTGLIIPTEDLLDRLKSLQDEEDAVDHELEEKGVPHIKVGFEKLYHSDDADEWKRVLQFLGFETAAQNLTRSDVQVAMNHVATNNPHHNMTLANYEEVRAVLDGTPYEHLLH